MIACPFPYLLLKTGWILSGAENSCYFCLQIRHCQIRPKKHKSFPSILKLIFASPQRLNECSQRGMSRITLQVGGLCGLFIVSTNIGHQGLT